MATKAGDNGLFDLSGRIALITGGGSGIGREYCLGVAEYGADVAVCDVNLKGAQETANRIEKLGRRAIVIESDVTQQDQVENMVHQTMSEFGAIDILFSNVGIGVNIAPLHEQTLEHWNKLMDINLTGMFLCMRSVLPVMQKQKRGSIICTSSIAGISTHGQPEVGPYGATKAGLSMLVRYEARAYAPDGIRINAIAPGFHLTEGNKAYDEMMGGELVKAILPTIPMGRFAPPSEIRGLAIFLASDASSFITGQTIASDGGTSA